MAANIEPPVPIRTRGAELEIDGGRIYPELPTGDGRLELDALWMWIPMLAWLMRCAFQRIRRPPVLRFAPGQVRIVEGSRETVIQAGRVTTRSTGSSTRLVAWITEGLETPLPSPPLLPLETAELAEILDAHVRVSPMSTYRVGQP